MVSWDGSISVEVTFVSGLATNSLVCGFANSSSAESSGSENSSHPLDIVSTVMERGGVYKNQSINTIHSNF